MKSILTIIMAIACSLAAMAQPKQGTFSITPRAGVVISSYSGGHLFVQGISDNYSDIKLSPKYRTAFSGGVDAEYQLTTTLSLSAGIHYMQQGCKYDNLSQTVEPSKTTKITYGLTEMSENLHYLQFPVLASLWVAPNLAVKIGVQPGAWLSGNIKYTESQVTEEKGQVVDTYYQVHDDEINVYRKFDLSIPIGISYEFENVVLDARYNIGLTRLMDTSDGPRHKTFMFTAGYRFAL